MIKKSEERLRWALRYIVCHPDFSPDVLSKEWKISIDEAIGICSLVFGTAVCEFGIGESEERSFKSFEKKIFKKLVELA